MKTRIYATPAVKGLNLLVKQIKNYYSRASRLIGSNVTDLKPIYLATQNDSDNLKPHKHDKER